MLYHHEQSLDQTHLLKRVEEPQDRRASMGDWLTLSLRNSGRKMRAILMVKSTSTFDSIVQVKVTPL